MLRFQLFSRSITLTAKNENGSESKEEQIKINFQEITWKENNFNFNCALS